MTFAFNKNYKDHEQIAEFFDDYMAVFDELAAAGKYPYDDSFKGRIPGLADATDKNETTAIYLCQSERHLREQQAKVDALIAEGFEHIDSIDSVTRFAHVVSYGWCVGGIGGWQEWPEARLMPELRQAQIDATGRIKGVIPKGKRNPTHLFTGGRWLVKR